MNAQQLRNSILQETICGRLVPQDPNDEPASALLNRIREEKKQLVKAGKLKKKDLEETPISEDEKPFDIPDSWEWCKLGWIGDWGAGATPAKGNPEYYDNGTIPWLRTGELNNAFVYDSEIKVTPKALEKCSLRMCNVGDVLIAMYGATIGKVAIAGIELTTNQACCACTPYEIYNKYLLYYLMASKKTFIEMGEGGAQPNISREKIIAFPFPLPPLAEQKRIVAKIEELLPKVEEYGKAQEELDKLNEELPEKLKKSVLQEAISGKLVPQDPNDEPASVLLERIREEKKRLVKVGKLKKKDLEETPISEDEKPFEIPESWEWVRLSSISKTITKGTTPRGGKVAYSAAGIGFLRAENVVGFDKLDLSSMKYVTDEEHKGFLSRSILEANDLLITIAGTLGRTALVRECDLPLNANQAVSLVRLVNAKTLSLLYVIYVLNAPSVQIILTNQKKVTAIPNLTLEIIGDCIIPLPPLAEQKRIVAKIKQLLHEIDKLKV